MSYPTETAKARVTAETITDEQMRALAGPPRHAGYSVAFALHGKMSERHIFRAVLASVYNQIHFGDKP